MYKKNKVHEQTAINYIKWSSDQRVSENSLYELLTNGITKM